MTPDPASVTPVLDAPPSLRDRVIAGVQYLLPRHLLSRLAHRLTCSELRPVKNALIGWFMRKFDVDLQDAVQPDASQFASFNDFFTRALRPDTRPVASAPECVISPVDGFVYRVGRVGGGRMLQAKGRDFSVAELLGEEPVAAQFKDGVYATLYLSPRDYHRIHMPLAGRLQRMTYIPGALFAVNPAATRCIPGLFTRNERIVALFDTAAGAMACVLVGALFVGSISTVWAGQVTPRRPRRLTVWTYADETQTPCYTRGAEMGRFNMGSTVIVMFAGRRVAWRAGLVEGRAVRMGQTIGEVLELHRDQAQ